MKKKLLVLILFLCCCMSVNADTSDVCVYSSNKKFGLKNSTAEITKAEYTKLIRLGDNGWIIQKKKKYGIMNSSGDILFEPKYRIADRVSSKYVKLGNDNDLGIYDENGKLIVPAEYSLIERISKDFYLTKKNYKYGLIDLRGNVILRNEFESIIIPDDKKLIIKYEGEWYEFNILNEQKIEFSAKKEADDNGEITVGEVIVKTGATSGYSVLTFTDYVIKLFSSISPAYEETIDELMFSKGADTVSIIMNFSWLPKLPFTYLKNYYRNVRGNNGGVLDKARNYMKKRM